MYREFNCQGFKCRWRHDYGKNSLINLININMVSEHVMSCQLNMSTNNTISYLKSYGAVLQWAHIMQDIRNVMCRVRIVMSVCIETLKLCI